MKKIIISFLTAVFVIACKNNEKKPEYENNVPKENISQAVQENENEWQYLFNGESAEGWRGYNAPGSNLPDGWVVEDGTLKSLGKGGDIGGDIIYGKEKFGEFELVLDWKIAEGGNSGIFYHIVEGDQYKAPYYSAPEYQIIDQLGFPQKLEPWQSIGADYGMYDPDYKDAVKEAGEWNTSKIIFTNDKVTYYLNGQKTAEFEPWSEDWKQRKQEGKWKDYPDYGKAKTGYIGLQDHGSNIWFKNIRIKSL